MQAPEIVVVGSSNMDLITYAPRLPAPGETLMGTRFQTGYGGKGANQAVAAARMGASVAMVARVGADVFGADMLANFAAQGIDVSHVSRTEGVSSGVAPIAVDDAGRNAIIVVSGANALLTPADVDAAAPLIGRARVLLCQLEVPLETSLRALAIARAAGVLTILNPAPAPASLPDTLLGACDLICPNETEASAITGIPVSDAVSAEAAGRALVARGAKAAIVTLGAAGCLYVSATETWRAAAPVVTAVDTTGAGDCFLGSLAFYLACGAGLRDAATRAAVVAALSVQRPGTQTSYPRAADLPTELRMVSQTL
ncbi:MAG: ribokinase [Thermoflexales bacterium]